MKKIKIKYTYSDYEKEIIKEVALLLIELSVFYRKTKQKDEEWLKKLLYEKINYISGEYDIPIKLDSNKKYPDFTNMIILCWNAFFRISYNMSEKEGGDFGIIDWTCKEILRILEEEQKIQIS